MRRLLGALLAALLLVALPAAAQDPDLPVGTVGVTVGVWDGTKVVPIDTVIVPPLVQACLPDGAS